MSSKAKAAASSAGPVTPEEYGELVAGAELRNIRLVTSTFHVDAEAHSRDRSNWKRSYDVSVHDVVYDASRSYIVGLITGEVICKVARRRLVVLKTRYIISYSVDGEPSDTAAKLFVQRLGAFAVYPYFRAHFAELCSQASLDLGPLPVMKQQPQRIVEPAPPKAAARPARAASKRAPKTAAHRSN